MQSIKWLTKGCGFTYTCVHTFAKYWLILKILSRKIKQQTRNFFVKGPARPSACFSLSLGSSDITITARRYALVLCGGSVSVRTSVRRLRPLAVTSRYCIIVAKHITVNNSAQGSCWKSNSSPPSGAKSRWGMLISSDFRPVFRYISETVHSYPGRLLRTRMRSIEWCYFHWTRVTHNYHKPPHFLHCPASPFISP